MENLRGTLQQTRSRSWPVPSPEEAAWSARAEVAAAEQVWRPPGFGADGTYKELVGRRRPDFFVAPISLLRRGITACGRIYRHLQVSSSCHSDCELETHEHPWELVRSADSPMGPGRAGSASAFNKVPRGWGPVPARGRTTTTGGQSQQ